MTYFLVTEDQDYPSGFKVFYHIMNIPLESDILKRYNIFFDDCTPREKKYSIIPVDRVMRLCRCKLDDILNIFSEYGYIEYEEQLMK